MRKEREKIQINELFSNKPDSLGGLIVEHIQGAFCLQPLRLCDLCV